MSLRERGGALKLILHWTLKPPAAPSSEAAPYQQHLAGSSSQALRRDIYNSEITKKYCRKAPPKRNGGAFRLKAGKLAGKIRPACLEDHRLIA